VNDSEKLLVKTLTFAYDFELLWAYYSQSEGNLFAEECKKTTIRLVGYARKVFKQHKDIKREVQRPFPSWDVDETLKTLLRWARGNYKLPFESAWISRARLFVTLSSLKSECMKKLKLGTFPVFIFATSEFDYRSSAIRWSSHLKIQSPAVDFDQLIKDASKKETIVVVGDIRRSQDLMTYSHSSEDYSNRMVEFLTRTREMIFKHHGFFDKFTGDGYIAYFNEAISEKDGGYIANFQAFIEEQVAFTEAHFQKWGASVRKLPSSPVGLAIGADLGSIDFLDIDNHLVAVGDSIVWATRMSAAANASEVIVNNRLYQKLKKEKGLSFKEVSSSTKAGEGFLAFRMNRK
jgi:class 3 adenylate cyclase